EKSLLLDGAVLLDDLDSAHPLGDEDPPRPVTRIRDVRGVQKPIRDFDKRDLGVAGKAATWPRDLLLLGWHLLGDSGHHEQPRNDWYNPPGGRREQRTAPRAQAERRHGNLHRRR